MERQLHNILYLSILYCRKCTICLVQCKDCQLVAISGLSKNIRTILKKQDFYLDKTFQTWETQGSFRFQKKSFMFTEVCVLATSTCSSIYLQDLRSRTAALQPGYNHSSRLTAACFLTVHHSQWDLRVKRSPAQMLFIYRILFWLHVITSKTQLNSFFTEQLVKGEKNKQERR